MKYIFSNLVGVFILDKNLNIIEKRLFKDVDEFENRKKIEKMIFEKYKDLKPLDNFDFLRIFKDKNYLKLFYERNLELTKRTLKKVTKEDTLIIQAINNIDELTKIINILVKRVREWYELYCPEISKKIANHERFINIIISKKREELLKELHQSTIGIDLNEYNLKPIMRIANEIKNLYKLKGLQQAYLKRLMENLCPNLTALVGPLVGAKLISLASSLKHLTQFPASTIQLLGAEKALFRHLHNKKKLPPKHGVIFEHPLVCKAPKQERGKRARALADKISIAVKVDYFKGKFIGDKLRKELEERFK